MRISLVVASFLVLVLTTTADATSRVRVSHLVPDAPPVDVIVNGLTVLQDVPYLATSDYLPLAPGSYQVQVTPAGESEPILIDAAVELEPDTNYTVAATGLLDEDDIQPLVLVDNPTGLVNEAQVRFIHTSPDAPPVDVAIANGGPVLFADYSFRQASGDLPVAPGSYDLEVRLAGTSTVVLPLPGISLEAETNYSVFAIGLVSDDTLGALPLTTATPAAEEGRVRVAHLSPDAPNVDVYVDGALTLSDVPYETVSDYLLLAAGTYQVQVTPANENAPIVIDASVTVEAGVDYTVAATGLLGDDDLLPVIFVDDLESSSTETKVRVAHTSPDAPPVDVAVTGGPVLFGNLSFRQASSYMPVAPGTYDLEVRLAGTTDVVLPLPGVELRAGVNLTIFAIGLVDSNTLTVLPAEDVNDRFTRGDANRDGSTNLLDTIRTLQYLFSTVNGPICADAADFDDDGHLNLGDPIGLLNYLYSGGVPPASPFPAEGTDTVADDSLPCALTR